jgi:transcriptional regulator with XRE-family HTH domain
MGALSEVRTSSAVPLSKRKPSPKTPPALAKTAGETFAEVIPDHDPTASLLDPVTPSRELMAADEEVETAVSAEAAESFIEGKRIGERIKYLRQRKHMGLVELGKHTGLSASFLSQLETGRVVPTLRNLARIAMVFSKDMSFFFEPERPELFRIIRASDRQRLPQTGADEPGYYFESLGQVPADQPIAPYVTEFLPGNERNPARAHRHAGTEFLYMLSGQLQLAHDSKVDTLAAGDAVYFNAEAIHSYERIGDEACTALILTMPEPLRGNPTGSRLPLTKPAKR